MYKMGLLSLLFNYVFGGFENTQTQSKKVSYGPTKRYTPEEYLVYEQEKSEKYWHGVPLCELTKLARTIYLGRHCRIDSSGFLVFCYTSKSGKTKFSAQCEVDINGRLRRLSHDYYPGQWRDAADDFVSKANEYFSFDI